MNATNRTLSEQSPFGESMDATDHRRHLHGVRRQPAIRLDAVRQSDRREVSLGTRRHSSGIHHLRADRDLARPGRRLPGRPLRAAMGGDRRRHPRRHCLGDQFRREFACRCCISRAAIGGIGTGCVYGTCVGNALKWFPGRRGLAAGIDRVGIRRRRRPHHRADLHHDRLQRLRARVPDIRPHPGRHRVRLGLDAAGTAAAASLATAVKPNQTAHGYTPGEVLRSPVFYVMYVMFVLIAAGGLTMAASMAPIAKDFKIEKIPVELFGMLRWPALVFALIAQPHLRRHRPAVLRLAVGPDRPRKHHGAGVHSSGRRAVHSEPVGTAIR